MTSSTSASVVSFRAPHPVMPDNPGWGARKLATDADVEDVIALLRLNYDRVVLRYGTPVAA